MKKIINWFRSFFKRKDKKSKSNKFKAKKVLKFSDINFDQYTIYYSREIGIAKFLCPCGCKKKESIKIGNKVDRLKKIWVLEIENDNPTLYESFWTAGECNSHYFIRDGYVQWAQ